MGVVLYEMLTGRPPCTGDSVAEVLHAVIEQEAPPANLYAAISPALNDTVMRCLRKNPAERFSSIREFRAALTMASPGASAGLGEMLREVLEQVKSRREKSSESTQKTVVRPAPPPPRVPVPPAFAAPAPPAAPAPAAPAPAASGPDAEPGEFTRMFVKPVAPPTPPAAGREAPAEPASFTQMFLAPQATPRLRTPVGEQTLRTLPRTTAWMRPAGPAAGDSLFTVKQPRARIGRQGDNDIVLDDASVSRYHALVCRDADGFWIEDTGSSRGVYVDGERVRGQVALSAGAAVRIGGVELRFVAEGAERIQAAGRG
jgi:hypothetical protein